MADCPKCHFTQPDDQYCANCGVDMHAYKPEPDPLHKRLMQNLGAQVAVVVLIVAVLFSGIYVTQREVIDRKLRTALSTNSSDELLSEPQAIKDEVVMEKAPPPAAMALNAAPIEDTNIPTPTANSEPINRIEIAFAEVPMPLVQLWANEGQLLSEDSQTRSILVIQDGSLSGLRRQDWEPFFLPGGSTQIVNTAEAYLVQFIMPLPKYEAEVGMALEVSTRNLSSDKINFEIQAIMSLPAELDETVNSSTVTGTYEIPRGAVLVIVGLLPQSSIRGEAADALNGTPLAVMQSPEFLAGASEFALIIRPQ